MFSWKRGLATLGILLFVGVALYIGATLPPRAAVLTTPIPPTLVFGGYHIHTRRSDGSWSVDDVARAAAKAGLKFVILTDHGDATRTPDPPSYRSGVLVIDAVEISTDDGHVVALNLDKPAPYPLAGSGRSVIEDIHRLGGWAVVAHPDSPKADLRWRAWDTAYDGIEWLNADSEWRDEPKGRLVASALRSVVRGPESIAELFRRPDATISRWGKELQLRHVVALGAMDAHGSYWFGADFLKTVWQAVELKSALSGQAADDARRVLDALRSGHTYTILPAVATPAVLEFTATQSGVTVRSDGRLDSLAGPITLHASVPGVPEAALHLFADDITVHEGQGSLSYEVKAGRAAYRIEAAWHVPTSEPFITSFGPLYPGPTWLFSNPIYVEGPPPPPQPPLPLDVTEPQRMGIRAPLPLDRGWSIEHGAGSSGEVAVEGDSLRFGFRIGAARNSSPYAALVAQVDGSQSPIRRLDFIGRADRPTRISVQMRVPDGGPDGFPLRWGRSIYLDETPRTFSITLTEFEQIGVVPRPRLLGSAIRSVLFVVDTVNAAPGARGTVWISSPALWVMVPR